MACLLENVTNSIWHAFTSLSNDKNGCVMKSKLKVSIIFVLFIISNRRWLVINITGDEKRISPRLL